MKAGRSGMAAAALLLFLSLSCTKTYYKNLVPAASVQQEARLRSVAVYGPMGNLPLGSGLLVDRTGTVLTASHVVFGNPSFRVSQDGKQFFPAKIVRVDNGSDLALLSSELKLNVASLQWKDRRDVVTGEPVFLYGAPYGLVDTYLSGYVSHPDRTGLDMSLPEIPFIQTMGLSFPGASGAAVYALDGRIIGINRATFGFVAGNGIGLTIPSSTVERFLKIK